MPTYRFTFDDTGYVPPRRLSRAATAQVGRETLSRQGQIRASLPEGFEGALDPQLATLEAAVPLLERINVRLPQDPHNPIPASEAVLALIEAPVLLSSAALMNHFIDRHVGAVENCLQGGAVGVSTDPGVIASRALLALLFPNGKGFLRLSHIRQWHHIHSSFNQMTPDELALARTAGVLDKVENTRVLNAHFGLMLGVDLDNLDALLEDNPELDDDPNNNPIPLQNQILEALAGIFKLAIFLWPAPEQTAQRAVLIRPFLDELQRNATARNRRSNADS